jgi:hypothetical protein
LEVEVELAEQVAHQAALGVEREDSVELVDSLKKELQLRNAVW